MTKAFLRFFRWFCHPKLHRSIEGDLLELHRERMATIGQRRADFLLALDILLLFRPGIIRPAEGHHNLNQYGMIKSYLKTGWRTMLRNKGYSAINIGGLATGMAVTILIAMWIYDELSFNRSFENYDHIGHVMVHNGDGTYPSNPVPLVSELTTSFPHEVKHATLLTWPWQLSVSYGDKKSLESGSFMNPEGADIFSLKMIYGTRKALAEPNTILIAESVSKKLFGDAEPVGEILRLKNLIDVRVGGVYKDFSSNSELYKLTLIGSWEFLKSWMPWNQEFQNNWTNNGNRIFVELNEGVDFEAFSAKIKDLKKKHLDAERLKSNPELFVHPMSRWHLYSKFNNRTNVMSEQLQFVWLYGIIGAFVLILACINFMNLSTARSEKRAKEVGIRKTMGSLRPQLFLQFMSESFITVAIAAAVSITLVLLALPSFNDVAAKQLSFPWSNLSFWLALLTFVIIAGLMAGGYPALYLSSFKPVKVLKARMNSLPREILVVVQFTVSISLIVGTIVVYKQVQFAKGRPIGYSAERLIRVFMVTPDLYRHYEVIRNEIIQSGFAENVAKSSAPTTDIWSNYGGIKWEGMPEGKEKDSNFSMNWVMGPYGETIGWKIINGRDFSDQIKSDSSAIIVNRAAVEFMEMKDPIGKTVEGTLHIVGVIEDLMMGSPYEAAIPTIFRYKEDNIYTINIRLNPSLTTQEAIAGIGSVFQKYNPSVPFDFGFVDDDQEKKFASEMRVGKLTSVFSSLAIIISLLGLLGLSSFTAEQRTKEIGIRKVIGASIAQLWAMLTTSFVMLVALSCLIAFPIAYYFLTDWLTKFEYRVDLSPWIFVVVAAGALIVTLATVSYQAIRAALANPVDSLKSE